MNKEINENSKVNKLLNPSNKKEMFNSLFKGNKLNAKEFSELPKNGKKAYIDSFITALDKMFPISKG